MRALMFLGVAGLLLTGVWAPQAGAANLSIDDTVGQQTSLTHDANWEGGVVSNGTSFAGGASGTTAVTDPTVATFSGTWIVNSAGSPDPGTGIIYVVDPNNPALVSDIVEASWSTSSGESTISITVRSSPVGGNLGVLPAAFSGHAIVETGTLVGIQGSFRDPNTGAPVSIPSNLTIQFGSVADPLRKAAAPVLSHAVLSVTALLLLGGGVWVTRHRHPA